MNKFKVKRVFFKKDNDFKKIRVSKLLKLVDNHPYKDVLCDFFDTESIADEYLLIGNLLPVFEEISKILNQNYRYKIEAFRKDVDLVEKKIDNVNKIFFNFDDYTDNKGVNCSNLEAEAIYDSKNSFFDDYNMTKYANGLIKNGFADLLSKNTKYFRELAQKEDKFNKSKSYRLVKRDGVNYVRGITSDKYNEYGVDFAFVVSMLILHENMKNNDGTNFFINSCAMSESKLEILVSDQNNRDIKGLGQGSIALKISTNDLGKGALSFESSIRVLAKNNFSLYLFPRSADVDFLTISHMTSPKKVFSSLINTKKVLDSIDSFIKDLEEIKILKSPDELRYKIWTRIMGPRSAFREIKNLSDIFKKKIGNDINQLMELLIMCGKAEELEMDYELKDKLRYIISDIMLYGSKKIK